MNALKFYRQRNAMSQKDLADVLGVQPTSISRYEKGTRQLSVDKAKRIAVILNIEWTDLYKDVDTEVK